jgi:hypothetical protein
MSSISLNSLKSLAKRVQLDNYFYTFQDIVINNAASSGSIESLVSKTLAHGDDIDVNMQIAAEDYINSCDVRRLDILIRLCGVYCPAWLRNGDYSVYYNEKGEWEVGNNV